MPDDFTDKEEDALEHTSESGGEAQKRLEQLLEQIGTTLAGVADNTSRMAEHLATLQLQKAVEDVPHTARETVADTLDTSGSVGSLAAAGVDVPLATSEDVIHDAAETVKAADADVKRAKKMFKKRRG